MVKIKVDDEFRERVDALIAEQQMEIESKREPMISIANGNTYITWRYYDPVVEERYDKLINMLKSTDAEFSLTKFPIMDGDLDFSFGIIINGDSEKRAAFFKGFIDNGYKLSFD